MPDKEPIIKVRGLCCGYGETEILHDVSFDVLPGEIFVILGGSGCGKSTLLMNMIGLFEPFSGSVTIAGEEMVGAGEDTRLSILKKIGVMYQMGALFGSMSLIENVRLPLEEFSSLPPAAIDTVARTKLSLVGLGGAAGKMPSELSGGMRKRGAIARAMALDPKIIFLDEPSAGLDPVTSSELDDLIIGLSRSLHMTFVTVTHELPSIFKIADRVVMLDRETRSIIAQGKPQDLRENDPNPVVQSFFNRKSHVRG